MIYQVAYIPTPCSYDLNRISEILQKLEPEAIACNNWHFPYSPEAGFRIAHNDSDLLLQFDVRESFVKALVTEDNGKTCTDSCVEFFIALDNRGYYNFEFNCIGTLLLAFHKTRQDQQLATREILQSVRRLPSIGKSCFEEIRGNLHWLLTLAIPPGAFFCHQLDKWEGVSAYANFYKCGDGLSGRHYLSWQAVDTEKPDFHVPRCFAEIKFQ